MSLRGSVAKPSRVPHIYVLAGTNGAGKSSLMGAMLLQQGVEYFDPDEAAQRVFLANPGISQLEANSAAWHEGKRLLYDNSKEADPRTGRTPKPGLVLRLVQGKVRETCELTRVPEWAKPILAAALKLKP